MTFPELSYYQQTFTRITLKDETISARSSRNADLKPAVLPVAHSKPLNLSTALLTSVY
jgi:hypothetical protein